MPIYKCEKCGCIENTACSYYWNGSKLCSECDPDIGKWHGVFKKESATGMKLGNDGFLYSSQEVESGVLEFRMIHQNFKIIGDA